MNKNKTNLSVVNNAGIRISPSIIVGDTGSYSSGDILDANAVEQVVKGVVGNASEALDTIEELGGALSSLSAVATSGDYDDLTNKPTNISSFTNDAGYLTSHQDISGKADASDVTAIQNKIPDQASSENKLADKAFVNSSISTNTADFKGTYDITTDLSDDLTNLSTAVTTAGYTAPNNNDYCFVVTEDNAGNTIYDRYKYTVVNNVGSWDFEYALNNSSFTSDQWAAINSGITSSTVSELNNLTHSTTVSNIVVLTQAQYDALDTKDANTEYNIIESV